VVTTVTVRLSRGCQGIAADVGSGPTHAYNEPIGDQLT
jgi:hypothetical protein